MTDSNRAGGAVVELRDVSKDYDQKRVLEGVSLGVGRGEFFALVGPSGSGKSTILKLISGIETPQSGQVLLSGREVTGLPPYRRPVHTVFQNYALFPHLNVLENVAFPLRMTGVHRREREQRVRQALDWVELGPLAWRSVDQLSGGERQRVAVARALVNKSDAVLLDEPLSALDPHLRGQTLELLQEIQARLSLSYLYVTHDREEALRAAHRIGILNQGRLEQVGTPEELYCLPRTAFIASFLGPINWLVGDVDRQEGASGIRLPGGAWVPIDNRVEPNTRRIRLGVRPEALRFAPDGFLPARVVSRQFSGACFLVRLESEGPLRLTAELRADALVPGPGEEVRVRWDPASSHVFGEQS
jgi:ABC-type Fe3+/spermidine/putrescine transport system ATPase subunit